MPVGSIWYRDKEHPQRVDLPNVTLINRFEAYLQTGATSGTLANSSGGSLAVDLGEVVAIELGVLKQGVARFRCEIWLRGRKEPGTVHLPEVRSLFEHFEIYVQQRRKYGFLAEVEGEYFLAIDLREVIAINADRITMRSEGDGNIGRGLTFAAS